MEENILPFMNWIGYEFNPDVKGSCGAFPELEEDLLAEYRGTRKEKMAFRIGSIYLQWKAFYQGID